MRFTSIGAMLRNYLTLTLRTVRRQAGYVGLNVFGLSLGLAVCLLIGLFVRDELSYDRFHENADRIVRVRAALNVGPTFTVGLPDPAGPYLTATRPEVVNYTRVAYEEPQTVEVNGQRFEQAGFLRADPTFFDLFSFDILRGNPAEALARPGTAFITPEVAHRFFGDHDPVGRVIVVGEYEEPIEIAGIVAPPPANSIIQFEAIRSPDAPPDDVWDLRSSGTYLLLQKPNDLESLQAAMPDIIVERYGGRVQSAEVEIERLTSLYLHADGRVAGAPESGQILRGESKYVYAFGVAAVLILLVACVNYVNLATARATQRAREVGVRKAVGAARGQLIRQFLFDAALLTMLSLCAAALWVELLLPQLNALTDKSLSVKYFSDPAVPMLFAGVGLFVTLTAGLYPAVVLSSFRPVIGLRNAQTGGRGPAWLRRGLVAFQFAVSAGLLLCTAVMHRQLDYLSEKELGFEAEQVVQLASIEGEQYGAYKEALQAQPGVESVTIGPDLPGGYQGLIGFSEDEPMTPAGSMLLKWMETDYDFLETMEVGLVAGRFFDPAQPTDGGETLVLNESGARAFGWEPAAAPGDVIKRPQGRVMPIIGVVEDFHAASLRLPIEPLAIRLLSEEHTNRGRVLVRIEPDNVAETLNAMEAQHAAFFEDQVFSYTFLDDAFAVLFESEQRLRTLVMAFSILALVIAALGVLGLVAHAAERRTKEIGIRKVLGATERSIVGLLSKELLVLVGVGFVVAAPLAYVGMQRWLEDFAYRIEPGAGLFMAVGAALLFAAMIVAGTQGLRAARANPISALRSE